MKKFNFTQFLTENKLTRQSRALNEMDFEDGGDDFGQALPLGTVGDVKVSSYEGSSTMDTMFYGLQDLTGAETIVSIDVAGERVDSARVRETLQVLKGSLKITEQLINFFVEDINNELGNEDMDGEESMYEMKENITSEQESEVEEDYSKYESVEELMKEIETSTNEAAMQHKINRVKKAYESLESKATSLEEGEHASYIAPTKIKEMKRSAKKLRMMYERLVKEYDKKYASKKKVELNEEMGEESSLVKNLQDLTWEDVSSAFVGIGDIQPGRFKVKKGVNFPLPKDESTVVYTSSDFDAWKAKTIQMFGDVEVELNPTAQASFNQVKINNPDFQSKRSAYIDSKSRFLSRDAGMGRSID